MRIGTLSCVVATAFVGNCLLLPALAIAQTQQQLDWCVNRGNTYSLDQQIAGCTAVGQSSRQSQQHKAASFLNRSNGYQDEGDYDRAMADLNEAIRLNPKFATAFNNRGNVYRGRGDMDRAVADYNEAIRLDPKNALAFLNRGDAYMDKGNYDRAMADYNEAIRLDPKEARAFKNRGVANLSGGALPKALADLTQASALDPKNAYAALWLDIVDKRSNLPTRLSEATAHIDMTQWPAPIIRLYLGQITPEAVLAAADDPNANKKKGKVCEWNFFTGELALQRSARDEATRLFRLAAADCPKASPQWWVATAELKALGVQP